MGDLVAGIDIATANVRVQVHDLNGELVVAANRPLSEPIRTPDGRSEQDATSWWPAVRECLRECTANLGSRRGEIASLAVSATSGTVAPVGPDGEPCGPALMYDDRRGNREAAIAAEIGADRWRRTGITPSATSGLAHIAWLAARDPEARMTRVCHPPELIGARLVGEPVAVDSSHALKSGYDAVRGEWAGEVFERLRVPDSFLPSVVRPTAGLGEVGRHAAEQTGVPRGCLVRAGMTDGCAGQLACGAANPGEFVTVLGTTLVLKGVSERLVYDPSGAVYSHLHPDGVWLPGGAANIGGSALSDIDQRRLAELDVSACRSGPARIVTYPLCGRGERFPFTAPDAASFTVGKPRDRVEAYRARLEGVAFAERLALRRLELLGAPASGAVRTAGGGARSRVWCQVRASVSNTPVIRMPDAGTPLGAAVLAASGGGHPDLSAAVRAMVPSGELIEPVSSEVDQLTENYQSFVAELARRGWL